MTDTILKKNTSLKAYSLLRKRVREVLLLGRRKIEREKVLTYWNTGKLINEHVRLNNGRADYGKKLMPRLAKDLGLEETILIRCASFAKAFPKIPAGRQELTWSHYRALLPIKEEAERVHLAERAEREHWDSSELEKRIKKARYDQGRLPAGIEDPLVEPKAGTPGRYRVVKSGRGPARLPFGGLAIDLGFATYAELSKEQSRGLKEGDIIQLSSLRDQHPERGSKQSRTEIASASFGFRLAMTKDTTVDDLYAYPAELLRVVDGDTLWMKIRLTESIWIKQKLRLRGIDSPELGTPEGEAAKRFMTSVFSETKSITITTTKPDKWDRYLSDVFLEMKKGEVIYLNNHLLENGHAFRYDQVKLEDWDVEW